MKRHFGIVALAAMTIQPVVGDWDGNDTFTVGVFRAGLRLLRNSNTAGGIDAAFAWGSPTDVPVVGDWDGNRITTIGVRRSANWYQRDTNTSGPIDRSSAWGAAAAPGALPPPPMY